MPLQRAMIATLPGPRLNFSLAGIPFWTPDENQSGDLSGWWARLRSPNNGARLTAHCRPQLDPHKTGLPVGGRSFSEFREILRTGVDLDHLHPPCSAGQTANCLPSPFDGNLLQTMPWYAFHSMTEGDVRAVYEYLRAIPCIE